MLNLSILKAQSCGGEIQKQTGDRPLHAGLVAENAAWEEQQVFFSMSLLLGHQPSNVTRLLRGGFTNSLMSLLLVPPTEILDSGLYIISQATVAARHY